MDYWKETQMELNNTYMTLEEFMTIIKKTIKTTVFFGVFFAGVWKLFGAGFLNDTIDDRVHLIVDPVIEVLDTTYYVSIETRGMVKGWLKENKMDDIIDEAEEAVDRQKRIDYTRKKLGKDKYNYRRKK